MASNPKLLSLFWRAETASLPKKHSVRVALNHLNVLDELEPVPALLLYPALLTPAVHVAADNDGMFEILILGSSSPELTASDVNLHLKMTEGLDPFKHGSNQPLFASTKDNITVKKITPDANGILKTENVFRGQLDARVAKRLKDDPETSALDTYYAVRIRETCLSDKAVTQGGERTITHELQDKLIIATLLNMNGPDLRGQEGRGLCSFAIAADGADISQVDQTQPIRAYHPLCFYPKGELVQASFGHVADVHLNARQQILCRTPARVIDAPQAANLSPPIGGMMNVFGRSFHAILQALGSDQRADVLLAGGDYMDHARNVYPYRQGYDPNQLAVPTASTIWSLMDVRRNHGADANYQAFVDLICFFGEIRWFYQEFSKPIFAVAGNHDCYNEPYGISPRILWKKANEGIPADHNLTFYEAILGFGESFSHLQKLGSSFDTDLFEWYFTVMTPFSDFTVELPSQRIAGLGWGEDEECISWPGSMGQGFGHLPRAEETVSDAQLALVNLSPRNNKKTVLFTHFTFVSYLEDVSETEGRSADARQVDVASNWQWSPFTQYDMGTLEKKRQELYAAIADVNRTQLAISGHSHRKGVYFLGAKDGDRYPTEMHGLRTPFTVNSNRTPIIVSDSAGPTPRLNMDQEFSKWGSDRPAGSLVVVSSAGQVASVEAIPVPETAINGRQAKPRLAVALDYRHVMDNAVFDTIETRAFPSSQARRVEHVLNFRFARQFRGDDCRLAALSLFCRASVSASWREILLSVGAWVPNAEGRYQVQCTAQLADAGAFFEWLTMPPKSGRFMSMRFRTTNAAIDDVYEQESAWNLEVACRASASNILFWTDNSYVIIPHGHNSRPNPRRYVEAPSFAWRRRFPEYQ